VLEKGCLINIFHFSLLKKGYDRKNLNNYIKATKGIDVGV